MNTTEPARPEHAEMPVSGDVERTVRERLSTIEQDKKTATPWPEVKLRILETPLPR